MAEHIDGLSRCKSYYRHQLLFVTQGSRSTHREGGLPRRLENLRNSTSMETDCDSSTIFMDCLRRD